MKRTLLILIVFPLISMVNAQNFTEQTEKMCKHQLSSDHFKHQLLIANPLLDEYDVKFYKLDINAERNTTTLSGVVTILSEVVSSSLDTFAFELKSNMTIDSVRVNGITYPSVIHANDEAIIPLTSSVSFGNLVNAQIYYHGTPVSSGFFSGINSATSSQWGNQVTWTLSEPFNAIEWWPCKQDLRDKADSVYVFVTTSSDNKVGSNGLLTNVVSLPNNKARYEWKSNYPIDYYLISFSVAKYVDYSIYAHPTGLQDSILIQNYVYDHPSCLPTYKINIDQTANLIELLSDLYSMYPFKDEKYGHCLAEIGGGMEHQTMTTIGSFSFGLVAHELGHMWFGDNVTCATWSDIWINEGFASYTEYLSYQYLQSQSSADSWMASAHSYIMSQPNGSVYIPPLDATNENRIFDGRLSYKKGAAIIHMIRFELNNDSLFFLSLHEFQNQFKDSVATGIDFKNVVENISGQNFTDFFDQWYFGEGYPTYSLLYQQYSDTLFLTVIQTTSTTATPLFKMGMEYKLNYSGGDTIIRLNHNANITDFEIPFDKNITSIDIDPKNWVINQAGSITVGTDNKTKNTEYAIYPNPVLDHLLLWFPERNYPIQIRLFDITGKQILQSHFQAEVHSIDLSAVSKGIYLLEIHDGERIFMEKVLKQ